jgi:hypothetical protein
MGPCDSGGSTLRCVHPFPAVVRSSRLNRGGAVRSHQRTTLKSNRTGEELRIGLIFSRIETRPRIDPSLLPTPLLN